jgi:phosphoribosylaminoimidazole-succinocarboxamide synthase
VLERTDLRLDGLGPVRRGKVRDSYAVESGAGGLDRLVLITTDRLSAFDRVLGCVAHKGQVLNQLAAWWFTRTADLVSNHLIAVPDPNVTVARACRPLPVEVVVRGNITGVTSTSLWTRYADGERVIYGHRLPEGLRKDDPLPEPLITPTTKAQDGAHDEPVTMAEVVSRGLVAAPVWEEVCEAALVLFARGRDLAAAAGLTLVDTKYEFGLDADARVTLIDEIHTPDSSRYWQAGTTEPQDKELVRRWYAAQGYRGDGDPPPWPEALAGEMSAVYRAVYERLTGQRFEPAAAPAEPRIATALERWLAG